MTTEKQPLLDITELAAQDYIESLTNLETVPALINSFGDSIPEGIGSFERLMWLQKFTNANLNFRNGKERQEVGEVALDEEQQSSILATASEIGMLGETHAQKEDYDFMTILGGANQSNLLRVRHAKEQIDRGIKVPYVALLGSARKLLEKEKVNVSNYAPNAHIEFDLMNSAFEQEFGVTEHEEQVIDIQSPGKIGTAEEWRVRTYFLANGMVALSVCAPLNEGTGRADTSDTYRFMHEVVGHEMLSGKDILNVTTDLYVPFQHIDAMRLLGLPSGAKIETIGHSGPNRPASSYGQELNSMYNKAVLLQKAL